LGVPHGKQFSEGREKPGVGTAKEEVIKEGLGLVPRRANTFGILRREEIHDRQDKHSRKKKKEETQTKQLFPLADTGEKRVLNNPTGLIRGRRMKAKHK